jgi:hypothetical protein
LGIMVDQRESSGHARPTGILARMRFKKLPSVSDFRLR